MFWDDLLADIDFGGSPTNDPPAGNFVMQSSENKPTQYTDWFPFIEKIMKEYNVDKPTADKAAAVLEKDGYSPDIIPQSIHDILKSVFDGIARDSENLRTLNVSLNKETLLFIGIAVAAALILTRK